MSSEDYGRESFEYDTEDTEAEDTEAGDESFAAEGTDEGDEGADEVAFEADEGTDEADESTLGNLTEGDEGTDEADEGVDEAFQVSASARLRATEDRNRHERWARLVSGDVLRGARAAASAQRAIADRIRAIPISSRARVASVGSLQGAGVVTAVLPNGRRSRMRIIPTVAPISEVNRLRAVVLTNERRQATAIATNARAVASLATAQSAAVKRLSDQQIKSDKDLGRRLVEGDNRLDARITKELSGGSGIIDQHHKRLMRVMTRDRRRAMMNNVLLATSVPFFVAYGDRETPFTADNAILTGSTLFWLLGDDVLSSFAPNRGFMQGLAEVWSYAGWAANGGGLYWWFRNKQTSRFLTGILKFDASTPGPFTVDLNALVAKDLVDAFKKGSHPVVATVLNKDAVSNAAHDARGTVDAGILTLSVDMPAPLGSVSVAWIVDTKAVA